MKLGSLFDGSGGFPLAGSLCGIEPAWAAEVEPYPIAVTRSRFPHMRHLGDVTKINGAEIDPVDIITFGSPCQDRSVAGKRAGLKHEANGDEETTRSGLFLEAIRIIREMRGATNGVYPRFAVWENVFGAFSSNGGEDFHTVLNEIVGINEPAADVPPMPKGGWQYADCYVGDGWSVAYRTFDAQYWGVPQRRRRIYLVAYFAGECAGKILFERDGVRGYFETGRTPWEGAAGDAESGSGVCDFQKCVTYGFPLGFRPDDRPAVVYAIGNGQADQTGLHIIPGALTCMHDQQAIVIDRAFFNQGQNAKFDPQLYEDGTCLTLVASGPAGVCVGYIVRRLTPTECARLQGFPDAWGVPERKDDLSAEEYDFWLTVRNTYDEINGKTVRQYTRQQMLSWYNKLHTDSAEYKMWGNGIALTCALYVMQGIVDAVNHKPCHVAV